MSRLDRFLDADPHRMSSRGNITFVTGWYRFFFFACLLIFKFHVLLVQYGISMSIMDDHPSNIIIIIISIIIIIIIILQDGISWPSTYHPSNDDHWWPKYRGSWDEEGPLRRPGNAVRAFWVVRLTGQRNVGNPRGRFEHGNMWKLRDFRSCWTILDHFGPMERIFISRSFGPMEVEGAGIWKIVHH